MLIKQISIFLENRTGRLAEVLKALGDGNIDISALSIADTKDFGILRLIVDKPDEAEKLLKEKGYAVSITNVIGIGVKDEPGGLAKALDYLGKANIDIEYIYAFVGRSEGEALVILKVNNPEKAVETLVNNGVNVLPSNKVYKH